MRRATRSPARGAEVLADDVQAEVDAGAEARPRSSPRLRRRRAPSGSTSTAGSAPRSSSAQPQWVVARRPSSRPAWASAKAPVQTEITRAPRSAAAAQRLERLLGRRLEDAEVGGDDDGVGAAQGARGRPPGRSRSRRGRATGGAIRPSRSRTRRAAAVASRRGGESLRRRRQVKGDDAVEAESDDTMHGRNLADIGIPATGDGGPRGAGSSP